MRAGLFPGQGIPGRDVFAALPPGDELLEAANELLGYDLRRKVEVAARRRSAPLPTSLAQVAIFVAGLIEWRRAEDDGEAVDFLCGHSLGEYTALVAAGGMSFADGLKVVDARGQAMHQAGKASTGGMVAVLGLDLDTAQSVSEQSGTTVANDNAPGQAVLAGPEESLSDAAAAVRTLGGRAVLLEVSGAYHTPAMASAEEALARALGQAEIGDLRIPVVSNVSAEPHGSADETRAVLVAQLTERVRFRESLEYVWERGVTEARDFGPGQVVAGLARRTFGALAKTREVARA
jgi:[acyl-carrier-protein] S-malonyltransferase